MKNMLKLLLTSLIYIILCDVPIFFLKASIHNPTIMDFIREMLFVGPSIVITFLLLLTLPYIGIFLISILFLCGITSTFFIYSFKKTFDEGVLNDILSVELDLILGYAHPLSLTAGVLGILLIYYALYKSFGANIKYRESKKSILTTLSISILILGISSKGFAGRTLRDTLSNYMPYNIIWAIKEYNKNYKKHLNRINNKTDLFKAYSFNITQNDDEPLIVVMIIGESMRGDMVTPKNMPLLHKRNNIVMFKDALSSETSTREAIPYMLTSATAPNIEQSLSERSFISIFKQLGFETNWIGNQGIFGVYETTFASIALEADSVITKSELRKTFPNEHVVDGHLIPFFNQKIPNYKKNSLTIVHLMGSHWRFDQRLPTDFTAPFTPECRNSISSACSSEQLMNSYENSLYYTDIVLDKLLKVLENKNAIVIYASDHGFSLGENGFFGNASKDPLAQKEQTNIMMFMWMSDIFMKKNPALFTKIQKHNQKIISQDYIFHSILDCSGVQSDYINPALSLCK